MNLNWNYLTLAFIWHLNIHMCAAKDLQHTKKYKVCKVKKCLYTVYYIYDG